MQPINQESKQPHLILSNPINGQMMQNSMNVGQDPNGFIMVDTLNINTGANNQHQPTMSAASAAANSNTKKSKKSRRKNKNKKDSSDTTMYANTASTLNNNQSKLVTLRNPLFQQNNDPMRKPQPAMGNATSRQLPMNIDQPAAIIKNENGMFTIRNPALHHALSQTVNNSGNIVKPPYGSDHYPAQPNLSHHLHQQQQHHQPQQHSQSSSLLSQQYANQSSQPSQSHTLQQSPKHDNFSFFSDAPAPNANIPKHTVAIGSEVKNAQQQRKQQMAWQTQQQQHITQNNMNGDIFNHLTNLNPQQSYNSTTAPSLSSYSFNSDFIGASSGVPAAQQQLSSSVPSFYKGNGYNAYPAAAATADHNYLFSNNGTLPRCDESPTLSSTNNYYEGVGQSFNKNYDDMAFLHNLQPGQRLNSEVSVDLIFMK